jgi:uncharacterized protein (DUF2235 family)
MEDVDAKSKFDAKINKRMVLFLDGTWNAEQNNTNVWRMKCLCSLVSKDGAKQLMYYGKGIGSESGDKWRSNKEGAFGLGILDNITNAYGWIVAGMISLCGVLQLGAPLGVQQIFDRYKAVADDETKVLWNLLYPVAGKPGIQLTREDEWIIKYSRFVNIKMVGVWDTVGSLGIPHGILRDINRSTYQFLSTGLRRPQLNAYHAVAIDEHRKEFTPTLWTRRIHTDGTPSAAVRDIKHAEQRWFAGAHANVGGGYPTDPLPQPPLKWMMGKAEALCLSFQTDITVDDSINSVHVNNSFKEFRTGWNRLFTHPFPVFRKIGYSNKDDKNILDDPMNETIDASVFERVRMLKGEYSPLNLVEWAKRRRSDLASIHGSVRADDPSVPVS